jgi:predicted membrane protein
MPLLYLVLSLIVVGAVAWVVNTYVPIPEKIRPVLNVVLALLVVGMALWLINTYVPMAESIKTILNFVVIVATCVLVLQALGLWNQVVKIWTNIISHHDAKPSDHQS